MRNRFLVPVFVSFALIAAACGGSGETATDEAPDTTEAPVEETTTVPATEAPEPVEDGNGASTPVDGQAIYEANCARCLLYTSPSPRDATLSRMPSSA